MSDDPPSSTRALVRSFGSSPLPVADLRHVHAVFIDVAPVRVELVRELLLEIGPLGPCLRQAIDGIHHQMETIHVVHDRHVEGRRDRALFLVAPDVEVAVRPAVGQPVDQPGITMEAKDDVFVPGEQRVVIRVAQSVRMLAQTAAS